MSSSTPLIDEGTGPAKLLRERLRSPIPVERFAVESLQAAINKLNRDVLPLAGMAAGDLVLNPHTELAALVALKNCAKTLAAPLPPSSADYDALVTIYFAAIASARVFHRQKISRHTEEDLKNSFLLMKARPWMPWELAELFGKAAAA